MTKVKEMVIFMFGEKLRRIRAINNITQEELGEKLGFSKNAIYNWEKGRTEPDLETLKKIAEYFKVSVDELILDKPIDPIEKLRQALKEANLYNGDNDMSEEDFKKALQIVEMLKGGK